MHLTNTAHTVDTYKTLPYVLMLRPPRSPDIAPSEYHLSGPLRDQWWEKANGYMDESLV